MNRKPRILVVDDDADIRTIMGLNLRVAGMEFGEAADGDDAIELLRAEPWDGCVLDLAMPRTDGFQVLRVLSETGETQNLVIVILSASGSPAAAIQAMQLGAHAHLIKPFSPAAVAEIVKQLIGLSPEDREGRRQEMINRAGAYARLGMPTI